LLQAAGVIGTDVPMPLLLAIADSPEEEVRAALAHLQAAEFLYEARLFPDVEYTFKHALTHEVAYGGLLHERKRVLHARITEAIEQLWIGRVADQAERLAHHALRGELWEKAVAYLIAAVVTWTAASMGRSSGCRVTAGPAWRGGRTRATVPPGADQRLHRADPVESAP
jgi:predicted ATPase